MISTNSFSKKTFTTGSGTFAATITNSTNPVTRESFDKGSNPWEGQNTASSAFGNEDVFGGTDTAFGEGVFGGMSHFGLRVPPTITH